LEASGEGYAWAVPATLTFTTKRTIERVPFRVVQILQAEGRLPQIPEGVRVTGFRQPTLAESSAQTWTACFDGPPWKDGKVGDALAVMAHRDGYDYMTSRDVREITHIAGSGRPVLALLLHAAREAQVLGLPVLGSIGLDNHVMAKALRLLGAKVVREVYST
jgi:hypothetical protein